MEARLNSTDEDLKSSTGNLQNKIEELNTSFAGQVCNLERYVQSKNIRESLNLCLLINLINIQDLNSVDLK